MDPMTEPTAEALEGLMLRKATRKYRYRRVLEGVGTLTFDQKVKLAPKSDRQALRNDWRAIRKDADESVRQVICEFHA